MSHEALSTHRRKTGISKEPFMVQVQSQSHTLLQYLRTMIRGGGHVRLMVLLLWGGGSKEGTQQSVKGKVD
jgi:hypothetical protein